MNISPLKFFGINNTAQLNNTSFFGLRLNNQPNKDSVSFSGRLKDSFQTKKDAVEYYKNIAKRYKFDVEYVTNEIFYINETPGHDYLK